MGPFVFFSASLCFFAAICIYTHACISHWPRSFLCICYSVSGLFCLFFQLLCVYLQLRRERIAERMKALQEMVPSANKVQLCHFASSMNNLYSFPFISHYHFYCVCISMYLFFMIIFVVYAYPCIYSVIYAVGQSSHAR